MPWLRRQWQLSVFSPYRSQWGAIDSRILGMYIPLVTVIWGFGFYFAMSAIMVDEPLLRFIGLMSFAVLEWGYFALMTTVNSTVSHPLLRILGF